MTSERYTHGHHESVLTSHRWRTVENSAAYLVPHLERGASVLDVGSGPGTITAQLAERVAPGRVIGLDAAQEIVDAAAAAVEVTNLEFVVGNAYTLPFADESFDIVHAHQVLQHVADPTAVLREMRRVAAAGGIVAARDVDYSGMVWFPELPGLDAWMTVYQAVHRSNGGEPDAGRRLRSWAVAAGFTDVRASASVWSFSTEEDTSWWGRMWALRVLESAFAADAVSKGIATQRDLTDISDAWSEWAASPDATLIMPHGEVICRG